MKPASPRLRVHFAPIGFEVVRVVEPMKTLKADVAILLTLSRTDRARFCLEKIAELLGQLGISTHVVECDVWDASSVVNEVGAIVAATPSHEFLFNVSTGPKTACMGGLISGMFWSVRPYYIAVNYAAKTVHMEQDYPVSGRPQFVPTFEIPILDETSIRALSFITSALASLQKREVLDHLRERGSIGPRQKAKVTPQALHGQLDSILQKLMNWGFIEVSGRGKALRIAATEKGKAGTRMLHHVLNPRKPIAVLG